MKRFSQFMILFFLVVILSGSQYAGALTILSGKVIDTYSKSPVQGAEVSFPKLNVKTYTDNLGWFNFYTDIDDPDQKEDFEINVINNIIYWDAKKPIDLKILNILGQVKGAYASKFVGSNNTDLQSYPSGIYFLYITCEGSSYSYKFSKTTSSININSEYPAVNAFANSSLLKSTQSVDTFVIAKDGYYQQKYKYIPNNENYEILKTNYDVSIDYLDKIVCPEAFVLLQGLPLNPVFGEVKSLKIVYSIPDDKIYYSNSQKYYIHYDFCAQVLGYDKGHYAFNQEQYTKNPNRIYILASLNHFTASDTYTLDFFAGDELDCSDIETVYNKVTETFFLSNKLWFYANSTDREKCTKVPIISSDELYKGQNYQPLNPEEGYGYLKKIDVNDLNNTYVGRHNIVLLNGIPLDIAVVAGIITTEFQTPLSHINVLSHNRETPNMALRDGWTNTQLNSLIDKLVYLKVSLDSFVVREASLQEAEAFWDQKEPQTKHILAIDTTTTGLVDLTTADINSVSVIGGKAANFAELAKVNLTNYGAIPLPEGYFAIPFYYYHQHIKKYGLDVYINNMLEDSGFKSDAAVRSSMLSILQDSIIKCPLDTSLLNLVNEKVSTISNFTKIRFRSSTNAEDIEGFNGAGLYDSYTGKLNDPDKPIDKAIKKVWASLWNYRAFEERDYFKIDHKTTAMGILVHRSFDSEVANGVVITENLYNPYNPAITINAQFGEISVVSPDEKYLPDQILFYTYSDDNIIEYVNHSNVPGMEDKTVMTEDELILLKEYCMGIYYHYCRLNFECNPLDLEFKIDLVDGKRKIYIKQARLY